jgi:methyltransferase (TIGR00027 family)
MTEETTPLPPVGLTGVGVAVLRALETTRTDRLFEDPYAASFVEAAGMGQRLEDAAASRPLAQWVAVRTRFLDEVVLGATKERSRQVIILGAGLDTRAFRLPWPAGTRLWELDLPDVLAFKEGVISAEGWEPACERVTLPVDLSADWGQRLREAGFDQDAPSAWLAEGLLAYLTTETRDALVARAGELSAPGSRFGLTLSSPGRLKAWREAHPDGTSHRRDFVALWQSEAPDDASAWLASLGWQAQLFNAAERSEAYGRPVEEGTLVSSRPRLVEAVRA